MSVFWGDNGDPRPQRKEETKMETTMESQSDYLLVRDDILAAINRFALLHERKGHFLMAVLKNDLREAINRADPENRKWLAQIVCYCHNEIPSCCWGSPEKVEAWIEMPMESYRDGLMAPETQKELERQEAAGIWGTIQFRETEKKELQP